MRSGVALVLCLLALAGCGGGDGGSSPPPQGPSNPPVVSPPPPPPVIGAAGGTITTATGASLVFPAGAVNVDTTFRIATDSTGAPPIPAQLSPADSVYVITPHGGNFEQPVEVSIPVPSVTLLDTQEFKLAKADPNGEWRILDDSEVVNGKLKTTVRSFSFFTAGQRQGLSISNNGQYVAFALNSVALTGSSADQVMVYDGMYGSVGIVSLGENGVGDGNSAYPQISGDGRYVLFETHAPNLTGGLASPWSRYAVVRDLLTGESRIASHALNGAPLELGAFGRHVISGNGRTVAFVSGQVYAEPSP